MTPEDRDELPVIRIDKPEGMKLMPPAPGKCHQCATDHEEGMVHNHESIYYHVRFQMKYRRNPRWSDAIAHCTLEVQKEAIKFLRGKRAWKPEDDEAMRKGTAIAEPTTYAS